MKGQINARMPGLRATRRLGTGGGLPLGTLVNNGTPIVLNSIPVQKAS